MAEIFYKGIWRMDWGLGNPNLTAALIATLMVAVWALAYIRRWGFWVALPIFTGLGACLIHTFSRGGIVALVAGAAILLWWAPRPWSKVRIFTVSLSIWAMIGYSFFLSANERYVQGVSTKDESITNRLEMWQYAPAMMVDAPGGWGYGTAGRAYMNWYQPENRLESYRTLVNSHLTWLVEFGWWFRFLYVAAWLAVFLICWPSRETRWLSAALGVWMTLGGAAIFSSVAESPWLWIAPGVMLLAALAYRLRKKNWPRMPLWAAPLAGATAVCVIFLIAGMGGTPVQVRGKVVTVGSGENSIWVVADEATLGKVYGKTLRKYLGEKPFRGTIKIVESVVDLPDDLKGELVVVPGKVDSKNVAEVKALAGKSEKLILLSPAFYPQEAAFSVEEQKAVQAYFGEFSQSHYLMAWEDTGRVQKIIGIGDYFPSWPEIAIGGQL